MKLLYISCYPDTEFKALIDQGCITSQAAQKLNKLIVKGFCLNGFDVDVLLIENREFFRKLPQIIIEEYAGRKITYYIKMLPNIRGLRRLKGNTITREFVGEWCKHNPNGILFTDILKPYTFAAVKEAKKNKNTVISHVTDFPEYLYPEGGHIIHRVMRTAEIRKFYGQKEYIDYFLFLTKYMNEKLNISDGRFIVLEGMVDTDCAGESEQMAEYDRNSYMYTGAISKQFGLKTLVEAFCSDELSNQKLLLYGTGDYVEEIKRLSQERRNILYCGYVPNENVLRKQKEVRCLINPRPVGEKYTLYSFPSKNIEYMLSGRPVITTKLPGIPDEYDDYVYYFDDDSLQGMEATLKRIVNIDDYTLSERGMMGRRFVLDKKNNRVQVEKILEMVQAPNLRSLI